MPLGRGLGWIGRRARFREAVVASARAARGSPTFGVACRSQRAPGDWFVAPRCAAGGGPLAAYHFLGSASRQACRPGPPASNVANSRFRRHVVPERACRAVASLPIANGHTFSNPRFARRGPADALNVPGSISTSATSINDSGQVAGEYFDGSGAHGFVYSNGTFTTLDVPGSISTWANSINNNGQVTGFWVAESRTHGFVYSNGTFTTLDVSGSISTSATSINDSGQVAGRYFDGSGGHGFIATPMGPPTDIPTLRSARDTCKFLSLLTG